MNWGHPAEGTERCWELLGMCNNWVYQYKHFKSLMAYLPILIKSLKTKSITNLMPKIYAEIVPVYQSCGMLLQQVMDFQCWAALWSLHSCRIFSCFSFCFHSLCQPKKNCFISLHLILVNKQFWNLFTICKHTRISVEEWHGNTKYCCLFLWNFGAFHYPSSRSNSPFNYFHFISLQVSKVIIYIVVIELIQVEIASFQNQVKIFEDSSVLA